MSEPTGTALRLARAIRALSAQRAEKAEARVTPAARARALHEKLDPIRHSPIDVCDACGFIERALTEHAEEETEALRQRIEAVERECSMPLDMLFTTLEAHRNAAESGLKAEAEAAALRESEQSAIRGRDMAVDIANARSREAAALREEVEALKGQQQDLEAERDRVTDGWRCPGCGRCWAPWKAKCDGCGPLQRASQPYPPAVPIGVGHCSSCGANPCLQLTGCPRVWFIARAEAEESKG